MGNVVKLGKHKRPLPPVSLLDDHLNSRFEPTAELADWFRAVFIDADGPLYNPEHEHLQQATIGALWTTVPNTRAGRTILGQAEKGEPMAMGKWSKAKAKQQVNEWFGISDGRPEPDFIMTIYAPYAAECSDIEFCALIEHELYHMGQEHGMEGPKFRKNGLPAFTIRGHDVEEFVGVVARYGASATKTAALVEAANRGPEIGSVRIAHACGTCQERRVA